MFGMRARLAIATLGAVGASVVGATTSTAAVGPLCFGDVHQAVCVIVDPSGLPTVNATGGPGVHDCVFVGPPPCVPVNIPTPSVTPGSGSYVAIVYCTGDQIDCVPIVVKAP